MTQQHTEDLGSLIDRLKADPDQARKLIQHIRPLMENQSLRCLQSLADHSSIIFWQTDHRLRYTWVNPAFEEILGYARDEVLGKTPADLLEGRDRDVFLHLAKKDPASFHGFFKRVRTKQGRFVYLLSDGLAFHDENGTFGGYHGFSVNVTRQVLVEKSNKKLISLQESMLEAAPDAMVLINKTGKVVAANQNFWKLWKIPENLRLKRDLKAIRQHILTMVDHDKTSLPEVYELYHNTQKKQDIIHLLDGRVIERFTAPQIMHGTLEGRCCYYKDITRQHTLLRRVMKQAYSDPLTGLYNRRWCENTLTRLLKNAHENQLSFLYMDIDHFKAINDACGHVTGDRVLRELSQKLLEATRDDGDLCRLGGDEFGMIVHDKNHQQTIAIAEKIRQIVKQYRLVQNHVSYGLGISIGLVSAAADDSVKSLFVKADEACYLAKSGGRDNLFVYHEEQELIHRSHQELYWFERLQTALAHNHLQLWQQPVFYGDKTRECYREILLRHVQDGRVSEPCEFMSAVERFDLAQSLDRWVIETLFSWLSRNREKAAKKYSINLSGRSITKPAFLDFVMQQFATHHIPYHSICFEITENEIIQNLDSARKFIHLLRDKGCRFSLDDFGKGLTSFAYLKELPFDYIKIDGQFITGLNDDKINEAIVKSVVYIARVINKSSIAEHVEDAETLATLRLLGVNRFQGHFLARPEPLA